MKMNRKQKLNLRLAKYGLAAVAVALLMSCSIYAQQVLNVWPDVPPGSETWTQKEMKVDDTPLGTVILNVVNPTITVFLPDRAKATGTGVIIAPGGAFVALAIEHEGYKVAHWLQEKGIAAFVLKYRVVEKRGEGIPAGMNMDEVGRYGIADGIQALKVVRQHAAEWAVSPQKIGFLGFSAGAMVTSGALLNVEAAARPSFAAMIYGGPFGAMPAIPPKLPPIFMAWAQDDSVALAPIVKFSDALKSAGHKPEVHIFSSGGHGFGMRKQSTTSDHWIEDFYYWLEAGGFIRTSAGAG